MGQTHMSKAMVQLEKRIMLTGEGEEALFGDAVCKIVHINSANA